MCNVDSFGSILQSEFPKIAFSGAIGMFKSEFVKIKNSKNYSISKPQKLYLR